MDVLFPEALLRIYMDAFGLTYDMAEAKLSLRDS